MRPAQRERVYHGGVSMPILINQGNQVTFIVEFFDSLGNVVFGFQGATLTVSYTSLSTNLPTSDVLSLNPNNKVFTAAWGNSGSAAVGLASYAIIAFSNTMILKDPSLLITKRLGPPDPT